MQTERTRYVPKMVAEAAAELHEKTGVEPEIDQTEHATWRITTANDRVRMTADFGKKHGGRVRWLTSRLWVDGEERPICDSPEEFYRLFNDPDSGGRRKWTPEPIPPERPVAEAPEIVQAMHARLLEGAIEGAGPASVKAGYEDGIWTVFLITDRIDLRVFYVNTISGWRPPLSGPAHLRIDGENRTSLLAKGVEDVLRALRDEFPATDQPSKSSIPGPRNSPKPGKSVEVRRTTVIRV